MKLKNTIFSRAICILFIMVLLFLSGCQTSGSKQPISLTTFQLNTVITITIYDSQDQQLLQECEKLCQKYEQIFSRTSPESELYKLNHGELEDKGGVSHISKELAELIQESLKYAELSQGAFDPTIGPVSSLWDFTGENPQVPDAEELQQKLPLVDYRQVQLNGQEIRFLQPEMQLDLGAIAKGYIADRLKDYLEEQGVTSATINLGGNVLCIGGHTDGKPFSVGIQKPFAQRNEVLLSVDVDDLSVVSSGIYERYFESNGTLYHHILNPKTGMPYNNGLTSVSILSSTSVEGDGLSTACFALGLKDGIALLDSLEGVCGVFVDEDGELHYSEGFPTSE